MEIEDAQNDRSHGSDACPNGVGRAQWKGLRGFHEQQHAEQGEHSEAGEPERVRRADGVFRLAQTESKGAFAQSGNNQNHPIHNGCQTILLEGCGNVRRLLPEDFLVSAKIVIFPETRKGLSARFGKQSLHNIF